MAQPGVKFARIHGRVIPLRQGASAPTSPAAQYKRKAAYHGAQAKRSAFSIAGYAGIAAIGSAMMSNAYKRPKTALVGSGVAAGATIGALFSGLGFFSHLAKRRGAMKAARKAQRTSA